MQSLVINCPYCNKQYEMAFIKGKTHIECECSNSFSFIVCPDKSFMVKPETCSECRKKKYNLTLINKRYVCKGCEDVVKNQQSLEFV